MEDLSAFGVKSPPEPWTCVAVYEHLPARPVPFGPRPTPRREVPTQWDEIGQPIAWRNLSDKELAAWQRDYDADPNRHGGVAVEYGTPLPVEAAFEHPPTGSRVEARWMDGQWHAFEMDLVYPLPDTSWCHRPGEG